MMKLMVDMAGFPLPQDVVAKSQRERRQKAQAHVDELKAQGSSVARVKIMGCWHGVHNGTVLKAPEPSDR